jgi:hypothetical protein
VVIKERRSTIEEEYGDNISNCVNDNKRSNNNNNNNTATATAARFSSYLKNLQKFYKTMGWDNKPLIIDNDYYFYYLNSKQQPSSFYKLMRTIKKTIRRGEKSLDKINSLRQSSTDNAKLIPKNATIRTCSEYLKGPRVQSSRYNNACCFLWAQPFPPRFGESSKKYTPLAFLQMLTQLTSCVS